jgi:hypothetical protein
MVRVPASPSLPVSPHRRAPAAARRSRAFSLLEILMALFILMIGVVIVGTVFPVAGDWTRQSTEHTIAQNIARNAVATIQTRCRWADFVTVTDALVPIPNEGGLLPMDLAYNYGNSQPMPEEPLQAERSLYFWHALVRHQSAEPLGAIDVYILVYKKGEVSQTFGNTKPPKGYSLVDQVVVQSNVTSEWRGLPVLWKGPYRDGTEVPKKGDPPFDPRIFPPVGDYGIGALSGSVFRQHIGRTISTAAPSVPLTTVAGAAEDVYWAPPADGTNTSPLVYVYHTTLAF